jgi:hypothetical protein
VNTVLTARLDLPAEADALEARFGLRVTARLEEGNRQLPHDISERLRVARMQALAQARQSAATSKRQRRAASSVSIVAGSPGAGASAATLGRHGGEESMWWSRLGWIIPALALVVGLLGIGRWQTVEQIAQIAQLDAELLGDDLPPNAYADDGFSEFLRKPPEAPAQALLPGAADITAESAVMIGH